MTPITLILVLALMACTIGYAFFFINACFWAAIPISMAALYRSIKEGV